MEKWINNLKVWFGSYCDSFKKLTDHQKINFGIKKEHSLRVADFSVHLAKLLDFDLEEQKLVYFIGLFHDIGRFQQLVRFNTFHDAESIDHAEYSVKILRDEGILNTFGIKNEKIVFEAIHYHNKLKLSENLSDEELMFARLIRDADKIDILKVLTDYYSNKDAVPNHTLTWELPKGISVSEAASKEILDGKLVSKINVVSEIDVKIMQLSWVYDINYRPSFEFLANSGYLESIYNSLPENDLIFEIYRKIKTFMQNKML
jgi:putative nucleotidyltransferase with HDIG domain